MQTPNNEAIVTLETNKVFYLSHTQVKPTVRIGRNEDGRFPFSLGFVLRDESGNPIESIHAAFGTVQGIQRYLEILFVFCTQLKDSPQWETLKESDKMVIGEILAAKQLYEKNIETLAI